MLVHDLILQAAQARPTAPALVHRQTTLSYAALATLITQTAHGLLHLGLQRRERVAIYLPKRLETVAALFGTSLAGGVFVPVNPLLKAQQVAYMLRDCKVRVLITAAPRAALLAPLLPTCPDLQRVILVDEANAAPAAVGQTLSWAELLTMPANTSLPGAIDHDMAAILYTSGSSGKPKGVILSQRNLVAGAASVASYLGNHAEDRLLAALPFSFDYGLSQLTTAFSVGACVVLMDYLLARDVVHIVERERITGLAAVPPMWVQLAQQTWPAAAVDSLRYFTNSGGAMPQATLAALRRALPKTAPFLMYGLTEAFRSTYLPPAEVDTRPTSIGKAIPNAEILVLRPDGTQCAPGEEGELVHRGALVSLGYWNDAQQTALRFRPLPQAEAGLPFPEIAVWSGDTVRIDADGFLYFVGRNDDMIKTSGYRVSPSEVEEVLYSSAQVAEAAAFGVAHPHLGQAIVAVVQPRCAAFTLATLEAHCKQQLPNFMLPLQIIVRSDELPRNANGKIDRRALAATYSALFSSADASGARI